MKTSTKVIIISTMLLAAGGVAYLVLRKKSGSATIPSGTLGVSSLNDTTKGNNSTSNLLPGGADYDDNGMGVVTNPVIQTKPVETYVPSNPVPVVQDNVRDSYMRSLKGYITDPKYLAAFDKMTNDELAASWYYVGTYLTTGNPLLNSTKVLPSGEWDNSNPGNPGLFNKITAIRTKYGIF